MKLAFTTINIGRTLDLDQCIEVANLSGCAGIEFRTGRAFKHGVETSLSDIERKAVRRKMEDHYLEVSCLNTGCMLHYTEPSELRENIQRAKLEAKLAYDLGCGRIRVFGNEIPEGVNAQECISQVSHALTEIADCAAGYSVDVLLEMHGDFNFWGYTLPAVLGAGRPNVGILYNCDDLDLVGGSMRETFNRVKPYVRHVHVHDLAGKYPYQQLFDELVAMDYQGYVSAELDTEIDPYYVMPLHNKAVGLYIELARRNAGRRA